MGKDDDPPPAPDYTGAAEATAEGSREAAALQTYANRVNQYTPWGSTTYDSYQDYDPATNQDVTRWNQTTNVTGDAQRALEAQEGLMAERSELGESMMGRAKDEFGDPMDWDALQAYGSVPGGGMDARQKAEDALYGRATSRLNPQWEQRMDDKKAEMVAQGLRPGDAAYDREMENLGRERTDAYQQAQYAATSGGGQEASAQQGRELTEANYANQLRAAQVAETGIQRGLSLNEINALISGQQVAMPSAPTFATAGASQGADYLGAAQSQYGAGMDAYNADQAQQQGMMSGLGSLASSGAMLAMMSDRRLKNNIKRIGTFKGYPFYSFNYIWDEPAVGVMADEVNSDAVFTHPSGYKMVNYGGIA